MKKIHYISLLSLFLVLLLGVIYLLFISPKEVDSQQNLADLQEIISTGEQEMLEEASRLTPEKQKQLDGIKEIYSEQQEIFNTTLTDILRKYKADFTKKDQETLFLVVETSTSENEFKNKLKEELSMSFLKSDIRTIFNSKEDLREEKELELTRLEIFEDNNKKDIGSKTQTLVKLSIQNTLKQNTSLSDKEIEQISRQVSSEMFEENAILEYDSFVEQKSLLQDILSHSLKPYTSLSLSEKQILMIHIIEDISELELILLPQETQKQDKVSFLLPSPIFESFQKLGIFMFPKAYASELSLTPEEREILILKTDILIERILQESIETEILYNKGDITQQEYGEIIEANLIELEELVILKDSLENDASVIDFEDIQRFNLGNYIDDSVAIQNLPVLAYIQEKSGHIIVHNLNGSAKLGEENFSLYSGYGIETLGDSTATIVFSDESILRLEAFSRVNISTPSSSNINVAVERGTIWTRVLKPLLSGDIFTIDSDGISLGVRGTSLAVTKGVSSTTINIVDSYTSDGSPSVSLTQESSGTQTLYSKGKEISIDNVGSVTASDLSRSDLLNREPQIADFLKKDLTYLSLLLDDRKRGFYNTPIVSRNDSEAFLKKIVGELDVSLPQGTETQYILENTELGSELVSTGSIYHLIRKDALITNIKNNPVGNTAVKVQAVKDLNMQDLEQTLGSKRDLENRFHYHIEQDVISESSFTVTQLEDIFLGFPIESIQDDAELLAEIKDNLSINNGSNIVTGDISLPDYVSGVNIAWENGDSSVISPTGQVTLPTHDISVILTATLTIGNLSATKDFGLTVVPREPTDLERLAQAQAVLTDYITSAPSYGKFVNMITLPNFSEHETIIPNITWTGSSMVNNDGSTNRPTFSESPLEEYKSTTVTAQLSHPTTPTVFLEKTYTIGVKRLDGTDEEMANAALLTAKESFQAYFEGTVRNVSDSLSHPTLPSGVVVEWINGNPYISQDGGTTRPSYNTGNQMIYVGARFTHPDTTATRTLSSIQLKIIRQDCPATGTIISGICYELVANAEYNSNYKLGSLSPTNTANRPAIITQAGQTGIKPLIAQGHELSYDISSLNLGDDWAIEMSVRGEDLKRSGSETYYMLAGPSSFAINSWSKKIRVLNAGNPTEEFDTSILNNQYYKVSLIKNSLFINDSKKLDFNNITLTNNIHVGVSGQNRAQWNGNINYFKIYKKN